MLPNQKFSQITINQSAFGSFAGGCLHFVFTTILKSQKKVTKVMAERFNNRSRIFQLALSDVIQSNSRVSNMETARYTRRETKAISSSEDERQHLAPKPTVKQKSSKFLLQREPLSPLPLRNSISNYYQTHYESSSVSDCGSISSEHCPSIKHSDSSTTNGTLATMKKEDCIPFIYARPISSLQLNQSEIDCDNPSLIEPPSLKKNEQFCSLSDEDCFALLPQQVSTQVGFSTSGVYGSQPGDRNTDVKFGAENSTPPPNSSNPYLDSFCFPDKVDSSSCKFLIPNPKGFDVNSNGLVKCESFVPMPKICDSNSFSLESCDLDIPSLKSCDSDPFFSFNTQSNSATYETVIPTPKSCDTLNPSLKSNSINLLPFSNVTDCKTVVPSPKSLQSNLLSSTIPSPKDSDYLNSFPPNLQTSSAACETAELAPKIKLGNSFPFANQMDWANQKNVDQKCNQSSVEDISVCDINIPILEEFQTNSLDTTSLKLENQTELALKEKGDETSDLFPDDFLDELIEVGSRSLNNSIIERATNVPELDVTPISITCQTNCILPVKSIEPKNNFDTKVYKTKEENNSIDQCHLDVLNAEVISGSNCINQLKVVNTISSIQRRVNVLLDDPKSAFDYQEQSNTLNDSSFDLNESELQNSFKESRMLQSTNSRNESFKKSSKSIDSGLGFLSEENLTISLLDLPSVFPETESNILPFTPEEDDSALLESSELDTYIESERERIDNLIDELLEI